MEFQPALWFPPRRRVGTSHSNHKILYSITKEQTLNDECLQTALCEVEAVLNARPITVTSGDSKDPEPLTPNHLLLLKGKPILPPGL